jgi:hypothetical protein
MGTRATGELADAAAAARQDQAATICGEMAARRAYVPLSSRPIRHLAGYTSFFGKGPESYAQILVTA